MQSILAGQYGFSHCDVVPWKPLSNPHELVPFSAEDYGKIRWIYPSLGCVSGHHIMPYSNLDEAMPGLRYFAFLRNPVSRMASAYQELCKHNPDYMSFESYSRIQSHRNQQCQVIGGSESANDAIELIKKKKMFVGLMEHFDESLLLLKSLHIEHLHIDYKRRNDAPNQVVAKNLLASQESRKILEECNVEDLKLYEYVKSNLYESYRQRYGDTLSKDVIEFRSRPASINQANILKSKLKRKLVYEPIVTILRRTGLFG